MEDANIESILASYRIGGARPLFTVGNFDTGVTVLAQQIRALNLVTALIESGAIKSFAPNIRHEEIDEEPTRVAIVGGGFTGLTLAAALRQKGVHAAVTLFEKHHALIPLQNGSDSRWLHPRIYEWPEDGSESDVAMLPVLNWRAGRASDVVVQVLNEWRDTLDKHPSPNLDLFCNTQHLQVSPVNNRPHKLRVEWVGTRRDPKDATQYTGLEGAEGSAAEFDLVILAIGFGMEKDKTLSYWRNENIGQPEIGQSRKTYVISGQGDGAMIDLLRLCISQYRQDRILGEVFSGKDKLLEKLKLIQKEQFDSDEDLNLFDQFEEMSLDTHCADDFRAVCADLSCRLRSDTEVILRLKSSRFGELFSSSANRISFQNRLLIYLVYKCGGFFPSTLEDPELMERHTVSDDAFIRRHGTERLGQISALLSRELLDGLDIKKESKGAKYRQKASPVWPGGYFGFKGKSEGMAAHGNDFKASWRKEYLPGATSLLASGFCSAVAAALRQRRAETHLRLRVTLHRAVQFGSEELLQQTTEYISEEGTTSVGTSGRTFPCNEATIGQAYLTRSILRSVRGIAPADLKTGMSKIKEGSQREMDSEISFVLAIPILEPNREFGYTAPWPVAGILYIDSKAPDFFIEDDEVENLVAMTSNFLLGLKDSQGFDRIRNISLTPLSDRTQGEEELSSEASIFLEAVTSIDPPSTDYPFQFNFDYSDFLS